MPHAGMAIKGAAQKMYTVVHNTGHIAASRKTLIGKPGGGRLGQGIGNSQGMHMRRMISVAPCLWLALGLLMPAAVQAQMSPEAAVGQALPPGFPTVSGAVGPRPTGPMTWGGVLTRTLDPLHSPGSSGAAELMAAANPAVDSPEDGDLLTQAPVIEFFTSQGCASCPPADVRFGEIARGKEVIALALHVDYWDYIGWADAFARPEFTKRQKSYARAAGSKVIYTPQMVVEGAQPVSGNDAPAIAALISAELAAPATLRMRLRTEGARRIVSVMPHPGLGDVVVQLVRYVPERTVTIERGENAGRTVTYHNIVTDWTVLGGWDGRDKLRLEVEAAADPTVLLIQQAGFGPMIAAARLP